MFGLFKAKPILSKQDSQFQLQAWRWLLSHFGGDDFYHRTQLVLPTQAHFPMQLDSNEDAALKTFEQVKKLANLENWPCRLEAQQEDANAKVAPAVAIQNAPRGPAGTFSLQDNNEVVITYNPNVISKPINMIATFAHELAHYLTGCSPTEPPGGWENWEFATDIAATFMGFGVFMANSAVNFDQHTDVDSQGWQYSRSGYLSEAEHIYSLAIFLKLKSMPIDSALPHLKPGLRKLLKKAMKELSKNHVVAQLKQVELIISETL